MPMRSVEWRHNRSRLLLPIALLPPSTGENPWQIERTEGLLDTGATATGVRADLAARPGLKMKGKRRIATANGDIIAAEYLVRIGFICGDLDDATFDGPSRQPYVLEDELPCFELKADFFYPVLIGMDVIGRCHLELRNDGRAKLDLCG